MPTPLDASDRPRKRAVQDQRKHPLLSITSNVGPPCALGPIKLPVFVLAEWNPVTPKLRMAQDKSGRIFFFFWTSETLEGKFFGWIRRSLFRAPWNPLYYPRRFLGCYWTLLKKNVQEIYGESEASSLWKALKRPVSNTKTGYKTGVFLSHFKYWNYRSWEREMPLRNVSNDSVLRDDDTLMISSN
jgi:hypothetical protein